jgi:hypothetical protein
MGDIMTRRGDFVDVDAHDLRMKMELLNINSIKDVDKRHTCMAIMSVVIGELTLLCNQFSNPLLNLSPRISC